MTNMLETATAIKAAADHAAMQDDRWLFIAALLVGLAIMGFVAKYWTKHYSALLDDHRKQHADLLADHRQDRDKYQSSLERIITQQNETAKSLAVVLDRNGVVLERNTEALMECAAQLKRNREERG